MATEITEFEPRARARQSWSLSVERQNWPLSRPFVTSGRVCSSSEVVVVVMDDGLITGRGEAAGVYYLEDSFRMMAQIESIRARLERGVDRADLAELLPPGGARNALDCALWELEAKRSNQAVWQLLGLERPQPVTTFVTIGADAPDAVARRAQFEEPFRSATAIKLKLAGDVEVDARRVEALRSARPDVPIVADANQGFRATDLPDLFRVLAEHDVAALEQPLPAGEEEVLKGLTSTVAIIADESVQTRADIEPLVGRFDGINIKLDKCGGLTEALGMVIEARRHGLQVMVGNTIGTSLAIAPAFLLAQLCDYSDLDGPLLLESDRKPGAHYEGGAIWVDDAVWGGALA